MSSGTLTLAQVVQQQADEIAALRAVVAFYADPRNWQPGVTRIGLGPGAALLAPTSYVELGGHHKPAADCLASIDARKRLPARAEACAVSAYPEASPQGDGHP